MTVPIDPKQQNRDARMQRRTARQANPNAPKGPAQQPYGYQGATNFAAQQQDKGTQYEQDVLGGKYLTPDSNPYLQKYVSQLGDKFQQQLGRGLSQVSSPFLSGATMGQSGIHGNARAQYGAEATGDFSRGITGLYKDEYGRERGFQQDTSQDISQRTQNLRNVSAQNYGSDMQARSQIQSAKIAANSQLEQARMAQALGYDQLAADAMFKYEQLNQQATAMEQDWIIRSGQGQANIMHGFSEQQQYGQPMSSSEGFIQGAIGGGLAGVGGMGLFGGGGNSGTQFNNSPAGRYFQNNWWGSSYA